MKLPKRFSWCARYLAAANPIAFKTEKEARRAMRNCYERIATEPSVTGVVTGGFFFHKDGEGDIELWVSPDIVWRA